MGLLDFFKGNKNKTRLTYAPTFNNSSPNDYNFYNSAYGSQLILEAIHCKQNEIIKIRPKHLVIKDGVEVVDESSSVAKVLKRPNDYMTMADFFAKCVFLRETTKNCYIYPEYHMSGNKKVFTALYPLVPREVKYLVDDNGKYFINLTFKNNYQTTLPANSIIHWRKDFDDDDYFGGNDDSDTDLLKAVNEYDTLCAAISKAVNCSCQINGIMKLNSYMSDEKVEAEQQAFLEKLKNNESGILFTDLKAEYIPMSKDVKLVDAATLDFFYEKILYATGTPKEILSGNYTKAIKESWYERAIEPDLRSLALAMEKVFFSDREEAFGNKIVLYPNNIVFMSMENKIAALQVMLPAGLLKRNEARELLGYPPLEGEAGEEISQGYNLTIPQRLAGGDNDD